MFAEEKIKREDKGDHDGLLLQRGDCDRKGRLLLRLPSVLGPNRCGSLLHYRCCPWSAAGESDLSFGWTCNISSDCLGGCHSVKQTPSERQWPFTMDRLVPFTGRSAGLDHRSYERHASQASLRDARK